MSSSSAPKPTVHIVKQEVNPLYTNLSVKLYPQYRVQYHASADGFLGKSTSNEIGCILMAEETSDLAGANFVSKLVKAKASLPIILTCKRGTFEVAVAAFRNGAFDVFEATWPNEKLMERIKEALAMSVKLNQHRASVSAAVDAYAKLSKREREVITLVSQGKSNKMIAGALAISEKTVETHRARSLKKLQVENPVKLGRLLAKLE